MEQFNRSILSCSSLTFCSRSHRVLANLCGSVSAKLESTGTLSVLWKNWQLKVEIWFCSSTEKQSLLEQSRLKWEISGYNFITRHKSIKWRYPDMVSSASGGIWSQQTSLTARRAVTHILQSMFAFTKVPANSVFLLNIFFYLYETPLIWWMRVNFSGIFLRKFISIMKYLYRFNLISILNYIVNKPESRIYCLSVSLSFLSVYLSCLSVCHSVCRSINFRCFFFHFSGRVW